MNSDNPDYILKLAVTDRFRNFTPVQMELKLAAMRGVERLTGFGNDHHRLRAKTLLFPSRRPNPWGDRITNGVHRCDVERRCEFLLLGASNSTKTSSMADTLIELWLECSEATSIYLASPYDDATETGLWARVLEQYEEARAVHGPLVVPGKPKLGTMEIIIAENNPLSFIRVTSIDKIGKLVGRKSKTFNVGRMIIASDELPEFKQDGKPLVRVLNNLASVPNFTLIGAGNFARTSDALGTLCEPDLPGGYYGLRVHRDYEWTTTRGGLVLRFDGDQSPALKDPDTYFFLPTERYRARLELTSGGKSSPDYYRYWHSFPLVGTEEFTVTNLTKIRNGGALEDKYEWTDDEIIYGSHCDPGFGGDAAIIQPWRMGHVHTGDKSKLQIWEAWGPPITVPLDLTLEISADDQIVNFHKAVNYERDIPAGHTSFDGSMRSGIVHAYAKSSLFVVPIDSNGPATTRPMSLLREVGADGREKEIPVWKDKVANLITEQWMSVGSLILSGQMRGLHNCEDTAVAQLCRRRWDVVGKKKKLETKLEYKKNNAGKSPNEADAIVGGVEMARRLGLRLHGVLRATGGSMKLIMDIREKFKAESAGRLALVGDFKAELPSGRLHGMSRVSGGRLNGGRKLLNGRLHR